jgi:hypothetical protein
MFERKFVCDMVRLECYYRGDVIPTGREYGRVHHYERCVCNSDGQYKDSPCPHALYSDNGFRTFHWIVPRKKQNRNGQSRVIKVGRNLKDRSLV